MNSDETHTHASLIERLKNQDQVAWEHFDGFYGPIIYRFARSRGATHELADEVRSSSYLAVVKQIQELQYDRNRGRFRNWLLTIATRRLVDLQRAKLDCQANSHLLASIESPDESPEVAWETQWRQQLLLEAFQRVERRMNLESREIFRRLTRESESAAKIANEMGITENTVYKTKQRGIAMLREELRFLEHDPLTAG